MWWNLLFCFSSLPLALSLTNLFDDGSGGPLIGTQFGLPGVNATYDYVIVGGGTAGLTLATRLAQEPSISVAVIEAGGFYELDNGNRSVVPGYSTFWTGSDEDDFNPLVDWAINSSPQSGLDGRILHYARGKTLGGSSARNYLLYQRPTIGSQKLWASDVDDESYTFDNFLPYFKKSAHYTPPEEGSYTNSSNTQTPSAFSDNGGPLELSFSNQVDAFGTWAQKAFIDAGMSQIDGFNTGHLMGSSYATLTIDPRNAHRSSSESSFLAYAIQNSTAPVVYKNTLATRILFNSTTDKTATGVSAAVAGTFGTPYKNFTISARKEVILSAGAFQSPQLLMVSGIGPAEHLRNFSIPVVADLPGVGQNMWDHPIFGTSHRVHVNTASSGLNNATLAAQLVLAYVNRAAGPLSIFGPGYYGWEKLPEPYRSNLTDSDRSALEYFPDDWPEIEWLPVGAFNGDNTNKQTADPRDGHNYATVNVALVAPLSRGTVTLQSGSMMDLPVVDPAWFTDETDQHIAIESVKLQRQMWERFVEYGVADEEEYFPGTNVTTDEEILSFIKDSMTTVYHASCTCKMGVESDDTAVVDSKHRVFGVKGLRVVDASSMPHLPPGHPQSTIYAMAEKVANDIIEGLGLKTTLEGSGRGPYGVSGSGCTALGMNKGEDGGDPVISRAARSGEPAIGGRTGVFVAMSVLLWMWLHI